MASALPRLIDCWVAGQGWPFPASTEVWVLPSTSGAAPMATADRMGPWQELSDRVEQIEWPRKVQCALKEEDGF